MTDPAKEETTTEGRVGQPEHFEEGAEAPPPGVHAMAIVRWVLLAFVAIAAFGSIYSYTFPLHGQSSETKAHAWKFHCPMHPQIVSDEPGECPICHMSLEPIPEAIEAPSAAISSPTSGSAPPGAHSHAAPKPTDSATSLPPGTTPITLAFDRIQAIGVRTSPVEKSHSAEPLRASATVEAPEKGRAEVHARTSGFVESIAVRDTGEKVKAGQLLASIYSPEVYQAEQELLAIKGWPSTGGESALKPPTDVARRKLELLGVAAGSIDRVLAAGQPLRATPVSSPIAGYVVKKSVVLGSRVTPEITLYEIADLAKVYLVANLYAQQLSSIHAGDKAVFTTPSLPSTRFETRVDLLYPELDLASRTTRVRFVVDNKDLALRPGQFGTIELAETQTDVLTVPLDAVVDTGTSTYVFVAEEGGRFTPVSVELGAQVGDRFVVQGGVIEGQRVVASATFLVDSESRLRASLSRAGAKP